MASQDDLKYKILAPSRFFLGWSAKHIFVAFLNEFYVCQIQCLEYYVQSEPGTLHIALAKASLTALF